MKSVNKSILITKLIFLLLLLSVTLLVAQDNPIKSRLNSLTSLNATIKQYEAIISLGRKYSIDIVAGVPRAFMSEDIQKIRSSLSELDQLQDNDITGYQNAFSEYQNCTADITFFGKGLISPGNMISSSSGYFITMVNGRFYHAPMSYPYWYPTGTVSRIHEPISDKYVLSELCQDAREKYPTEWQRYADSKSQKDEFKTKVKDYIARTIIPKLESYYRERAKTIKPELDNIASLKRDAQVKYKTNVDELRRFGVPVPEEEVVDINTIKASIEKHSALMDDLYDSYTKNIKSGKFSEGVIHLFKLYSIDAGKVHHKSQTEYTTIRNRLLNNVLNEFKIEMSDNQKAKYLSTKPLSSIEFMILCGFYDKGLLSNTLVKTNSDSDRLVMSTLSPEDMIKAVEMGGFTIPSINDLKDLTAVDENALANFYSKQVNVNKFSSMTTDPKKITGLLCGGNLLLYDETSKPCIYRAKFIVERAWGNSKTTLSFEKIIDIPSDGIIMNIRLKKKD
jgi:hypothetical protein